MGDASEHTSTKTNRREFCWWRAWPVGDVRLGAGGAYDRRILEASASHETSLPRHRHRYTKFFDAIPQNKAVSALEHIGVDVDAIAAWQYGLRHLVRFSSINGAIDKNPIHCTIGVPQGDPLSMLAAAALLGQWAALIKSQDIITKVFVDDRMLLGQHMTKLQECFTTTQLWDEFAQFKTQAKTTAFGNNAEQDR